MCSRSGCNLRCALLGIISANLILVLQKQVFDLWARIWVCIVANFVQILMLIFAVFGVGQRRLKLLTVDLLWWPVWIAWNLFLVCYYGNAGSLNREALWLSFFSEEYSWWKGKTPIDYWWLEIALTVLQIIASLIDGIMQLIFIAQQRRNCKKSAVKATTCHRLSVQPRITMELSNGICGANGYHSDTTGYLNASYDDSPSGVCPNTVMSHVEVQEAMSHSNIVLVDDDDEFIRRKAGSRHSRKQPRSIHSEGTLRSVESNPSGNNSRPQLNSFERRRSNHSLNRKIDEQYGNSCSSLSSREFPRAVVPTHPGIHQDRNSHIQLRQAHHAQSVFRTANKATTRDDHRRRSYEKKRRHRQRRSSSFDRASSASSSVISTYEVQTNPDPCNYGLDAARGGSSFGSNFQHINGFLANKIGSSCKTDALRDAVSQRNSTSGGTADPAQKRSSPLPNSLVSFDPKSDTIVRYHSNSNGSVLVVDEAVKNCGKLASHSQQPSVSNHEKQSVKSEMPNYYALRMDSSRAQQQPNFNFKRLTEPLHAATALTTAPNCVAGTGTFHTQQGAIQPPRTYTTVANIGRATISLPKPTDLQSCDSWSTSSEGTALNRCEALPSHGIHASNDIGAHKQRYLPPGAPIESIASDTPNAIANGIANKVSPACFLTKYAPLPAQIPSNANVPRLSYGLLGQIACEGRERPYGVVSNVQQVTCQPLPNGISSKSEYFNSITHCHPSDSSENFPRKGSVLREQNDLFV